MQHSWSSPTPCALTALIKTAWDLHNVVESWPGRSSLTQVLYSSLCNVWRCDICKHSCNCDWNETLRTSLCQPQNAVLTSFYLAVYKMALVAAFLFLLPASWACAPQKAGSYQPIKNVSIKVRHFTRTTAVLQFNMHSFLFLLSFVFF